MSAEEWGVVAQSCVAGATLVLAIAAFVTLFLTLRQTRATQREMARQAKLKEVADWITEAMCVTDSPEVEPISGEVPHTVTEGEEKDSAYKATQLLRIHRHLSIALIRGEYISKIAASEDASLHSEVEGMRVQLKSLQDHLLAEKYKKMEEKYWRPIFVHGKQAIGCVVKLMNSA